MRSAHISLLLGNVGSAMIITGRISLANRRQLWPTPPLCAVNPRVVTLCSMIGQIAPQFITDTFPARSPITAIGSASNVWGLGRIRRSTP